MKTFQELNLKDDILKAIEKKGFDEPTPIQELTIPRLLSSKVNIVAKARTGTGKTAAFALPLIQKIKEKTDLPQALILVPTRELAIQVSEEVSSFVLKDSPRIVTVYGGSSFSPQLKALKEGVEIVVGTPGRVIDHLERGSLRIEDIKYFILDEADEMLNMGFIEDIEKIFGFANKMCRVLMFSATMPKEILDIAHAFMGDYETIEEEGVEDLPILQEQLFYCLKEKDKVEALSRIIDFADEFYALIFCQTKLDAEDVAKELEQKGYDVAALHGDIPQSIREKMLERFRSKAIKLLVATDVAARGIDVEGITHVVNYALPFDSAIYTHRIGRTGRAGKRGVAISFVRPNEIRRLEYIKRSLMYDIREERLPSIKEVLEKKRTHLLLSLCQKLEENIATCKEQSFVAFTKKLLEYGSAEDVLTSLLQIYYSKELSPSRYKNVALLYREKSGDKKGGKDREHIKVETREKVLKKGMSRLFIAWGRKEGATKKKIAELFSEILDIPQSLVDAIEVENKFSFCSLPNKEAVLITRLCKKNKEIPHIHLDKCEDKCTEKRKESLNSFKVSRGKSVTKGSYKKSSNTVPACKKTYNKSNFNSASNKKPFEKKEKRLSRKSFEKSFSDRRRDL